MFTKILLFLGLFFWLISTGFADSGEIISMAERMKFFVILIPAALADSINPCAFMVLFILLWSIMRQSNSKKQVLLAWGMFILAVFMSYIAIGIGLYEALATASSTFYLKLVVGVIWILVWLANLKDYFWYDRWFKMEVPDSWRPKMRKLLKGVTTPWGAFGVGVLISLFLLPCTSGPYITVLGYLASESESINIWGYIYIVIYNLIFILPMLAIAIAIAFGYKDLATMKEYREVHVEKLHLLTGILMLWLGLYILFDILVLSV